MGSDPSESVARAPCLGAFFTSVVVVVVERILARRGRVLRDGHARLELGHVLLGDPRSTERPKEDPRREHRGHVADAIGRDIREVRAPEQRRRERADAEAEHDRRGAVAEDDELRRAREHAQERHAARRTFGDDEARGHRRDDDRRERSERIERQREHEVELPDARRDAEVRQDDALLRRPSHRPRELDRGEQARQRQHRERASSRAEPQERQQRDDERQDAGRGSRERAEDLKHRRVHYDEGGS